MNVVEEQQEAASVPLLPASGSPGGVDTLQMFLEVVGTHVHMLSICSGDEKD